MLALGGAAPFVRRAADVDALTLIRSGADHQITRSDRDVPSTSARASRRAKRDKQVPISPADPARRTTRLDCIDRSVETERQKRNGKGGSI